MSFRELRDFTEIMRSLGYPRIISVENFRTPNFALVADALYWMIHKYDSHIRISDEITTQSDRVKFISRVVQVVASHAQLKLNPKRLYSADGKAVRELLKLARLLQAARRENSASSENAKISSVEESNYKKTSEDDALVNIVLPPGNTVKALANEITESGAKLYDLLQLEEDLQNRREEALRFLDAAHAGNGASESEFLERKVRDLIATQEDNIAAMTKQCADLEHDERSLAKKIKKKRSEMERSEKRLSSLKNVRPAFMDELEKLEEELKQCYAVYVERYRNLAYLEKQLEAHERVERAKLDSAKRNIERIQKRLRKQGERLDRGTKAIDMAFDDHADDRDATDKGRRAPNASQRGRNLNGSGPSDASSDISSLDSDSDSDASDSGTSSGGDSRGYDGRQGFAGADSDASSMSDSSDEPNPGNAAANAGEASTISGSSGDSDESDDDF